MGLQIKEVFEAFLGAILVIPVGFLLVRLLRYLFPIKLRIGVIQNNEVKSNFTHLAGGSIEIPISVRWSAYFNFLYPKQSVQINVFSPNSKLIINERSVPGNPQLVSLRRFTEIGCNTSCIAPFHVSNLNNVSNHKMTINVYGDNVQGRQEITINPSEIL